MRREFVSHSSQGVGAHCASSRGATQGNPRASLEAEAGEELWAGASPVVRGGRAGRCGIHCCDSFQWALGRRAVSSCLVPASRVTGPWGNGALAQGESPQRRWWVRALGWALCIGKGCSL